MLSAHTLITILQAFQLVGLAPCLFMVLFLATTSRRRAEIIIPVLYFLSLACAFAIPLIDVWPAFPKYQSSWALLYGTLLFLESLHPALSFLLIMQIVRGARLPWPYWLVLALPLIGGSPMVYASVLAPELCLQPVGCVSSLAIQTLYALFGTALLFLLLMVEFTRIRKTIDANSPQWRDRYWLMISLVLLNLVLLALELMQMADHIGQENATVTITVVRLSFIYLVLTLMFRLFDDSVQGAGKSSGDSLTKREEEIGAAFSRLMDVDKFYRDASCNRETVARKLGVNENLLSRAISHCFNKRFTDVVNGYRVEEAKAKLLSEPESSITTIAFDVGFNSIPSFNRVFKDITQRSPSEFRTAQKAE